MDHLRKLLARDAALLLVAHVVNEPGELCDIGGGEKQHAIAGQSVASGSSGFLIVALDVLRQVVVDDEADVRLVDAHAERDRRAHHLRLVAQERLLIFRALRVREARVIRTRADAIRDEPLGKPLGGLAAEAINDPALLPPLAHKFDDLRICSVFRQHAIREVGPVEARDENCGVAHVELAHDVIAHALGGRRGERHERHAGEVRAQVGNLPVFGPEIVAPFRDAVRLVNRDERDFPLAQFFQKRRHHEPLGRDVEQPVFVVEKRGEPLARFLFAERGI